MDSAATHAWKIFDEVKHDMKPKEVMEEANRCLFCYDAPCMKACPTHIDVPLFIKKITTGNMKGSARIIMEANPVAATCARVCPTEELCEGACVLNDASLPIMIGDLQRHTMNWAIKNNPQLFEVGEQNGKRVAIIGAGPAGLSSARELARYGYQVTVFEKQAEAGGLDTYGIVPFRLPKHVALWEAEQIKKLGVTIQTNTEVGKDVAIQAVLDRFDAVVLAIGMAHVPPLGIPGEALNGVFDAIQLIERVKNGHVTDRFSGKKAVVIGAGNTAIDAATCLKRLGAKRVQIVYRRSEKEMTAYPFEYRFAKEEGIEFRWQTQPKRIESDESGNVTSVVCAPIMLGEKDASGRRRPIEIDNAPFAINADIVVKAIGQMRDIPLIEAFDLAHDHGVVAVDPLTYQTSNPKVYAAGDVIFGNGKGEAMVVAAAEQGKKTAQAIHEQLLSKI
ncbi:NAD(P)-dependent oxidoreductase [Sporolactobacillus terrae]|uniref:NAD(P)-dependent oxidoreductase n=1 Tax=Sporolactobacillus terrae TaxID=269673 RepID=UPI00048C1C93|nr:NAD(P)-dependent oxidoreductase [Sporolactobacillus terrae]